MPDALAVPDPRKLARIAGLLYLTIIALGLSGEVLVRGALVVPDDARATAANILDAPGLFRLGFAADALMGVCDVALAVLLFVLLRPVDAMLSLLAMVFRLIQAAILGANLLNHNAALLLLSQPGELDVGPAATLALVALQTHSHGYDLGLIFFGASCLILGNLLVWAPSVPRLLGPAIAAAGIVYLVGSFLRFLAPDWSQAFQPAYAVPLLAELAFALWLLVKGIGQNRPRDPAPAR